MAKRPKTPQEKKRLSLTKDRRNTYGENAKSSRKNIPRSKAISHREVRRKATEIERTWSRMDDDDADSAELTLVTPSRQKPKFRKGADAPLGEVVQRKLVRRRQAKQNS